MAKTPVVPMSAGGRLPMGRGIPPPITIPIPPRPSRHVGRVEQMRHPAGGTVRVVRHPRSGRFLKPTP